MEYESLKYLNFPNYKIDEYGNVYSFKFSQSSIDEKTCLEIKDLYKSNSYTQQELAIRYNISLGTLRKIIYTNDFWKKLKPILGTNNRFYIVLYNNTINKKYEIGRLVCETFHGPCPPNMECCHNDGNCQNNIKSNVRWDTRINNIKDKILHGTYQYGENNSKAKFSNSDIINIRELKIYCSIIEIARIFNTTKQTVSKIINKKRWSHI